MGKKTVMFTCKGNAEEGGEERGVGKVRAKQENQDSPPALSRLLLLLVGGGGAGGQGVRLYGKRVKPFRTGHRCPTDDTEGAEKGKSLGGVLLEDVFSISSCTLPLPPTFIRCEINLHSSSPASLCEQHLF